MANWGVIFVLVVAFVVHASARNVPSDAGQNEQKNFFPCVPKQPSSNSVPNTEQVFMHASAPTAEAPGSTGLKDEKNFIYGGVGGFAGIGGYAGVIGGLPILGGVGGIGKYGGIGGIGGVGGYTGLGGIGGLGGAGGGVGGLGGGAGGAAGGVAGGAAGGVGGAGGLGTGIFPCP